MSSRELSEWIAYNRLHPLPDPHWSTALICSTLINAWGGSTTVEDFLPQPEQARERTVEDELALFDAYAALHNARLQS